MIPQPEATNCLVAHPLGCIPMKNAVKYQLCFHPTVTHYHSPTSTISTFLSQILRLFSRS